MFTIELTPPEREELRHLVEHALADTHVEYRHTQTTEYRQRVKQERALLQSVLDKLMTVETG